MGGGQLTATLSLFSRTLDELEVSGFITRTFPKNGDPAFWLFGYLLDGVKNAATVDKYERHQYDHRRMLGEIVFMLEWAGHAESGKKVRTRIETAYRETTDSDECEVLSRLALIRRNISFAWAAVLEMHAKGIWPPHLDIDVYRQAYETAVVPGDTPSFLLDVRELVDDIGRELATINETAANWIKGFRTWKRPYH
jgi:hypothetical protein